MDENWRDFICMQPHNYRTLLETDKHCSLSWGHRLWGMYNNYWVFLLIFMKNDNYPEEHCISHIQNDENSHHDHHRHHLWPLFLQTFWCWASHLNCPQVNPVFLMSASKLFIGRSLPLLPCTMEGIGLSIYLQCLWRISISTIDNDAISFWGRC